MWGTPVINAPGAEPISIELAREQCMVLNADHDVRLNQYLKAARAHVERYCGLLFASRSVIAKCSAFADLALLPVTPVSAIGGIAYVDVAGATQTLSTDVYALNDDRYIPSVDRKPGQIWPSIQSGSKITVTMTAGGSAPEQVTQAMLLFISDSFERRSTERADGWSTLDVLLANERRFS